MELGDQLIKERSQYRNMNRYKELMVELNHGKQGVKLTAVFIVTLKIWCVNIV